MKNISTNSYLRVLTYVHLRNIHQSTGAGRTARQIVEHLAGREDVLIKVLADRGDMERFLPQVGRPWVDYEYASFASETSRQQARWFLTDRPAGESYWPEAEIVYCTAESYVPARRAKLVVTAHDAAYFEDGAHRRDRAFYATRMKWSLLYRKLARKAAMFHTVSQFSAERLGHFFPEIRSRIRWVHNGVTPHFFGPVADAGWKYLEDVGLVGRPFVLVPGGLHFRKNAELILEAAPKLKAAMPGMTIAVVNHTDPVYRAAAETAGLRLLGFVSEEALHALYSTAAVVWFPSRYEGFGLPVLEAMACGASVVASDSSSIPEIAGDAAMLVNPGDATAHVDVLEALLRDDGWRARLGAAGRERAAQFTWQRCADQLKGYFDELVGR